MCAACRGIPSSSEPFLNISRMSQLLEVGQYCLICHLQLFNTQIPFSQHQNKYYPIGTNHGNSPSMTCDEHFKSQSITAKKLTRFSTKNFKNQLGPIHHKKFVPVNSVNRHCKNKNKYAVRCKKENIFY